MHKLYSRQRLLSGQRLSSPTHLPVVGLKLYLCCAGQGYGTPNTLISATSCGGCSTWGKVHQAHQELQTSSSDTLMEQECLPERSRLLSLILAPEQWHGVLTRRRGKSYLGRKVERKSQGRKSSVSFSKRTDFIWNRGWEHSSRATQSKAMQILVLSPKEKSDSSVTTRETKGKQEAEQKEPWRQRRDQSQNRF